VADNSLFSRHCERIRKAYLRAFATTLLNAPEKTAESKKQATKRRCEEVERSMLSE
jgi:hypothetical protein